MSESGLPLDPGHPAEPAPPFPWEDSLAYPGFWDRVTATFRLAFTDPMDFFVRVPRGNELSKAWTFYLFCTIPSYLLLLLMVVLVGFFFALFGLAELKANLERQTPELIWIVPLAIGLAVLLMPLFQFVAMLVFGGLQHLFLWMFGGTREGLGANATIRATTYAWALIGLLTFLPSLIPYLGVLIVLPMQIAGMVITGLGLARMHRTDPWRGLAAVFAPGLLCCCCAMLLWFGVIFGIALPSALKDARRPHRGVSTLQPR